LLRNLPDLILAVDGGDSKVDVAIVDRSGRLVGAVRRASSAHFGLGRNGSLEALAKAIRLACQDGGIEAGPSPLARIGVYCVAGADLPVDDRRIAAELDRRGWSGKTIVRNDTFAVLRAGTDRGWGVAVVCGTGLNCAGIGPDGKVVRFPAFGELSGDRAHGGGWLGRSALGAAIRARDGRGPRTLLEKLVPAHFKMSRPTSLMEAMYLGRIDYGRASELSPTVFAAARRGDEVASGLIEEVADEIVTTAVAAIRRLQVVKRDVDVILGGGVFRSNDERFLSHVHDGVMAAAPLAKVRMLEAPPVLGAALIGLDQVRGKVRAEAALRAALTHRRLSGPSR
jgi:N-acetylglucosamine kinase-like BadF-type ATPase